MIGFSTRTAVRPKRPMKTWGFNWALIRYRPWQFAAYSVFGILFFGMRVIPGLIEKAVFDTVTGATPARFGLWTLIVIYVSVELARLSTSFAQAWADVNFRYLAGALLRRNFLASILRRPGAAGLPMASGEAINRFDDDVGETSDFPLWLPHVAGNVIATIIAVVIMATIDLRITLVVFIPIFAGVAVTRMAWGHLHAGYAASRTATGAVTGFLGELFGSVQAIKVANAEDDVADRLEVLNDTRRRSELRILFFREALNSINGSAVTFGIGVTLLLAGQRMAAGTFTVGDFALFVYYLWFTTELPTLLGTFMGDYKQQEVSINRMAELVRPEPVEALVDHGPIYEAGPLPVVPFTVKSAAHRLDRLTVDDLAYRFPNGGSGIEGINLRLERGSFTVVTGRIGSGKTTLLRVLLGLLPHYRGEIRWNGEVVSDPGTFFRPPRSAYTPQVPRLFSETLRGNILMGLPEAQVDLDAALRMGVFEQDVAGLERGLDTLVGPRGVRLSGGQVQRVAAARMFVRDAELLVFDDLSSALDVETERTLWDRLFAGERRAQSAEQRTRSALCAPSVSNLSRRVASAPGFAASRPYYRP